MATAALKQDEPIEPPEGAGEQGGPAERDYDTEARESGWVSKEEFLAKPNANEARWVDAKTFVERADTFLPIIKADRDKLRRELSDLRRDVKKASAHFEGAEKRAFDRAKADIEARIENATEAGDVKAVKAALKDMDELKPNTEPAGPKYSKDDALAALDAFRDEHAWYDRGNLGGASDVEINARAYADRITEQRLRAIPQGQEPPPDEFFASIAEAVYEKYPILKGKPARRKPASDVEGGGVRQPSKSGNTYDDLPAEGKRMCDRFVKQGITTREGYLKTYDWSKP